MCNYIYMSARVLSLMGLKVHSPSIAVPIRQGQTSQMEAWPAGERWGAVSSGLCFWNNHSGTQTSSDPRLWITRPVYTQCPLEFLDFASHSPLFSQEFCTEITSSRGWLL
jgi:hypothetical protein